MLIRIFILFSLTYTISLSETFAFERQKENKTHISFLKPSKSISTPSLVHKTYGQYYLDKSATNTQSGTYTGYLWSHGQFLFGIEGQFTLQKDVAPHNFTLDDQATSQIQGKAGIFLNNNFLLYATIGIINTENHFNGVGDQFSDQLLWGWTAGAGLEFTSQDGIRFGFDALYVGFEDDTDSMAEDHSAAQKQKGILGRARIIVPLK